MRHRELLAAAGAGLLALVACRQAHAVNVGVYDTQTGSLNGESVYYAPLTLDGVPFFCISPTFDEYLGAQPYVETPAVLTVASSRALTGYDLTAGQIDQVGALVRRGFADIRDGASGAVVAADAGAIWAVEGATGYAYDPAVQVRMQEDLAYAATAPGGQSVSVWSTSDGGQSVASVPEPGGWALMLIGIGAVGGALRRPSCRSAPSRALGPGTMEPPGTLGA